MSKVVKLSISELENVIKSLKSRLGTEEIYLLGLSRVTRTYVPTMESAVQPDMSKNALSLQLAMTEYDASLLRFVELRRKYVELLKTQVHNLSELKERHDNKKKLFKSMFTIHNTAYIDCAKTIPKLYTRYLNKCTEYKNQAQAMQDEYNAPEQASAMTRGVSAESRLSSESTTDTETINSVLNQDIPTHRKAITGFISQMRSQMTNAPVLGDAIKQNMRIARLKKEIAEADFEYRQGILRLERLRKAQVQNMEDVKKAVEVLLMEKSDLIKQAIVTLTNEEQEMFLREIHNIQTGIGVMQKVDSHHVVEQFQSDYKRLEFAPPKAVYYHNFHTGVCKDILFGSNLTKYAEEHNNEVPWIVSHCIEKVETMKGIEKEGIYRVSGRQMTIEQLKGEFEKSEKFVINDPKYDVFSIASVLKIYLRELECPIFHLNMQERIEHSKIVDVNERKERLRRKLDECTAVERKTLNAVIKHLSRVEECSQMNKMTMSNLSVIFTPAIFHDHNQAENVNEWFSDGVLGDLIMYREYLLDDINTESTPLSTIL
ncbi:Rho GTPase activation protein [Pilobolus umbonatus]|nr:Rho GTPase activation protein [Pilobolus umbonatus]